MDNKYLLSVGVNSKIKLWNENCLNIKSYKYNHGYIKSGVFVDFDKGYNKVKFIFGDDKGDIFMKQFIIGEENIKKFNEHIEYLNKKQKEIEEKPIRKSSKEILKKSMPKLHYKFEENERNLNFKESTFETDNTES